jgi:enoyl-CoA hydratase/carnithine racemase
VLRTERHGPVLRLVLCDNATRNSLSEAMLGALHNALMSAENEVVVIAAEGPAFSAGHNLKELTAHREDNDRGAEYYDRIFDQCASLMMLIAQHRCAVIAEVDGLASAAGCQLVAACDLAYASTRATFCTPGVNIGLFCSTPMVALSRAVAAKHAMEMLLTGDVYNADHAYRIGLVNAVVEPQQLTTHVMEVAQRVASKSQGAIAHGKPAFHAQQILNLQKAYAHCSAIMTQNLLEDSASEGIAAVLEKRKPQWPSR